MSEREKALAAREELVGVLSMLERQEFRAGYDAGHCRAEQLERRVKELETERDRCGDWMALRDANNRAEQLERELSSLRRDYQTSLALEQGLHDRALGAEKELAAERERGERMFHEYQDHLQQRDDGAALLEAALTAERAELQRCREVIERVRDLSNQLRNGSDIDAEDMADQLWEMVRSFATATGDDEVDPRTWGRVTARLQAMKLVEDPQFEDDLEPLMAPSAAPPAEVPCEFGPECPACKEERGDYWREECAELTRKLEQLRAKLATIRACVLEATA